MYRIEQNVRLKDLDVRRGIALLGSVTALNLIRAPYAMTRVGRLNRHIRDLLFMRQ